MGRKGEARRPLRIEPLWVRVDRNRLRFWVFVVAFVLGAAALLTLAFVAVPGSLIGLVSESPEHYYPRLGVVVAAAFVVALALGGVAAGVQIANAEHWVRGRFGGAELDAREQPQVARVVAEMAVAGGLPRPPGLLLIDVPSVNACAIGTGRGNALIGVTRGFAQQFSEDEQRAVIATLVARITRGDIMVGTALAALMGPLKMLRDMRGSSAAVLGKMDGGCVGDGCADGCLSDGDGCVGGVAGLLFVAVVAAITWVAIAAAAWLVTVWGRALHRTGHEKADAEGMLLLRHPQPMLAALRKAISSSNEIADGDPSYDGIFYASTSGTPAIEKVERRRYDRLREVLGVDGMSTPLEDTVAKDERSSPPAERP